MDKEIESLIQNLGQTKTVPSIKNQVAAMIQKNSEEGDQDYNPKCQRILPRKIGLKRVEARSTGQSVQTEKSAKIQKLSEAQVWSKESEIQLQVENNVLEKNSDA